MPCDAMCTYLYYLTLSESEQCHTTSNKDHLSLSSVKEFIPTLTLHEHETVRIEPEKNLKLKLS